jgi:hypothetical protein
MKLVGVDQLQISRGEGHEGTVRIVVPGSLLVRQMESITGMEACQLEALKKNSDLAATPSNKKMLQPQVLLVFISLISILLITIVSDVNLDWRVQSPQASVSLPQSPSVAGCVTIAPSRQPKGPDGSKGFSDLYLVKCLSSPPPPKFIKMFAKLLCDKLLLK